MAAQPGDFPGLRAWAGPVMPACTMHRANALAPVAAESYERFTGVPSVLILASVRCGAETEARMLGIRATRGAPIRLSAGVITLGVLVATTAAATTATTATATTATVARCCDTGRRDQGSQHGEREECVPHGLAISIGRAAPRRPAERPARPGVNAGSRLPRTSVEG
jgi:hypothetical protein